MAESTDHLATEAPDRDGRAPTSLGTAAARALATTTKTPPQMREITSRWLLRVLPWVEAHGGVYRANRRLVYELGDGRVTFAVAGADVRVVPRELRELPILRGMDDEEILHALADRFVRRDYARGEVLAERGRPADRICLIAHGKVELLGMARYGEDVVVGVLSDGDHFGDRAVAESRDEWEHTARALVPTIALELPGGVLEELVERSDRLRDHLRELAGAREAPQNRHGEAAIERASGHEGEAALPSTFVDYDDAPRQYELSLSQTIVRVHTRVGDLYGEPMDQLEEQLRLTVEALREEQEHELINNPDFGLLHTADLRQRISTRRGPPTPDDMDDLLVRRRKTRCYLAHPRAIAAFGRQCSLQGLHAEPAEVMGRTMPAWRGVPILPCNKIPIGADGTTSILAFRTGEDDQGVIGLHQTGLPDEREPGLNVRKMADDDRGVAEYLVSTYYSAAVLLPDALGILENVEIGR